MVGAAALDAGAAQGACGGGDEAEAVVDMADGDVIGPAVVRALEGDAVVALVEEVLGLRGLGRLQRQALDTGAGERSDEGDDAGVPFGAYVERQGALEGDPVRLDRRDAYGPFVGDVAGQLGLVVPDIRLGARAAARHVFQESVARVVGEAEQD